MKSPPQPAPPAQDHELHAALRKAVPKAIEMMHLHGRPHGVDRLTARGHIGAFRNPMIGETFEIARQRGTLELVMSRLVLCLATLAHEPGGVELWGLHFQTTKGDRP